MFKRLNVNFISTEYKKNFHNKNGKIYIIDNILYFILPIFLALFLAYTKIPDEDLLSLFGTSLSIFIGLFLNIIAILLSTVNNKKREISFSDQILRLDILKETIYDILYAIIQSIKAIIILYLMSIFNYKSHPLDDIFFVFFSNNLNYCLQFIFSILLYYYNIKLFISFYIIIKKIISLFDNEIKIEKLIIRQEEQIEDK